jgi:hypothetical protein
MKFSEFSRDLETYIRAKYPLLYIVSHEEERAEELMIQVARRLDSSLFCWSCTKGWVESSAGMGKIIKNPDVVKPMDALEFIQRSPDKGLYVLLDFHPYLTEPAVIRKLRDTIDVACSTAKSLFILSPRRVIPPECEKEFIVLDLPTPDVFEIEEILERSLKALKGRIQVDLTLEERQQLVDAFRGLPSMEIENVISRMVVRDGHLNAEDLKDVICEKGRMIAASGILQFFPPRENLQEVGGLENLKGWLHRKRVAFSQPAREFGIDMPKGVLLVGVPGCGKSLTAKAVSSAWQMPLLRLDIGQLFSMYVGSSEENMRKAIQTAESIAPCVLWIDEIEKGLSGSQDRDAGDGGVARRIFATLLTWMQDKQKPVFMVATANDVSSLPPEFLRKGRFDEIFFVDLPNEEERSAIFTIHLQKRKRDPAVFDVASLAQRTQGFSGADIEGVVAEGLETAYLEGRDVSQQDLENVAAACVPLASTMAEKIASVREWAEGRARRASS